MQNIFFELTPYYSYIVAIAVIVLVIFIFILFFIFYQEPKKPEYKPLSQAQAPKEKEEGAGKEETGAPQSTSLQPYLIEFLPMLKQSDLANNFHSANRFVRQSFSNKYALPWFLMVGPEASGKTTLGLSLENLLGAAVPPFMQKLPRDYCYYSFFDQGVLCNLKGALFMHDWRGLLTLLNRHRSRLPINGIVLTLSCEDLMIETDTAAKARKINEQIQMLQYSLSLKLPVYITVTHLDKIAGFNDFIQHVPQEFRQNIFGWSAPYDLNTNYSPSWMDKAFSEIESTLKKLVFEFLYYTDDETNVGLYQFWQEFLLLKKKLQIYCDYIFISSGYQNTPWLRGIYFTGVADNKVYFAKDLFEQKIFKEGGIVQPQHTSLTKHAKMLRLGAVTAALFLTFFGYKALQRFKYEHDVLLPVVYKMDELFETMQNISVMDQNQMRIIYDEALTQLVLFAELQEHNLFFSWAVPATWVSSFRRHLYESLHRTTQMILVRSLYYDLLLRIRNLINMRPDVSDHSKSLGEVLLPTQNREFKLVSSFVDKLAQLQVYIQKFNRLHTYHDPKVLDELLHYVFQSKLPDVFITKYSKVDTLLFNKLFPPIDLSVYKKDLQNTLSILYQNYYNALFDEKTPNSLPDRLSKIMMALLPDHPEIIPDVDEFALASESLSANLQIFGTEGSTWVDETYFAPGKQMDEFWDKIDTISIFGKKVRQYLIDQTNFGFMNLHNLLNNLWLQFNGTSSYLHQPEGEVPSTDHQSIYSKPIFTLERVLKSIFSQVYVKTNPKKLPSLLQPQNIVVWDAHTIQTLGQMIEQEKQFVNAEIPKMPVTLQTKLAVLLHRGLGNYIQFVLAKNQKNVTPLPIPSSVDQKEAFLRTHNLFNYGSEWVRVLTFLQENNMGDLFVNVRNTLLNTATYFLFMLNDLFDSGKFYQPKSANFLWWNGRLGAAFQGYNVRDNAQLQIYLDHQFSEILKIANLAKPVVEYLSNPITQNADMKLFDMWNRIVEEVKAKENKNPSSTISHLENYIKTEMNKITLDNISEKISIEELKESTNDIFLQLEHDLKQAQLSASELTVRDRSAKRYNELIEFFNENIRGKFPFVDFRASPEAPELPLELLKEFLRIYDRLGGSPDKILSKVHELGDQYEPHVRFLRKIDQVRKFFDQWMKGATPVPTFEVEIEFRVNKNEELNGQYVGNFWVSPNPSQTLQRYDDKPVVGTWHFGDPFKFGFGWVSTGDVNDPVPLADPKKPELTFLDRLNAAFAYNGAWALFKAVQGNNGMLRFVIRQSSGQNAVLFNRVKIIKPAVSQNEKAREYLTIPDFPYDSIALRDLGDAIHEPVLIEQELLAESNDQEDNEDETPVLGE